MDMKEMVQKVKNKEPLYGTSTLDAHMQGVAARNSRYSQLFFHVIPWFNFVNHNQVPFLFLLFQGTVFCPGVSNLLAPSTASILLSTSVPRKMSLKGSVLQGENRYLGGNIQWSFLIRYCFNVQIKH